MKLGAHVSTAGGISKAVDRAVDIGCEAIQIFVSSPQSWRMGSITDEECESFRLKKEQNSISPVFFHAIYLINMGTKNPENWVKGIESLGKYMEFASKVDVAGVIFHPGSHGGLGYDATRTQTLEGIEEVLDKSPNGPMLILENTAGMGNHIGARFEELGNIISSMRAPIRDRLRVCLDTQHAFAAGYDISTPKGLEDVLLKFDETIGLERLMVVHANDSKCKLGGAIDRHENIGEGYIGIEGFQYIINHPAFADIPFILEVPGLNSNGPDKHNLDMLKNMRLKGSLSVK